MIKSKDIKYFFDAHTIIYIFLKSSSVNLAGCFFHKNTCTCMYIKQNKRIHNDHLDGRSHPYVPCFGSVYE